ncbi:MAG: hypothetical protein PHS04_13530 [Tissierellia bacterium]|nr:hypothetical protein [Tissierellia bacterium]
MKTKNLFLTAAILISGFVSVNGVKAEGTPANTDNVTLNIKFKPIQTIVVNPSQKTVDIEYYTKANYRDGVSVTKDDHLTVFSTGGFNVSVQTNGDFINGTKTIGASDVVVSAKPGSNTTGGTFSEVALSSSSSSASLISSETGGSELNYNITYDNGVGGGYNYINMYTHPDTPESVYTAEVTYTIVAN